MTRFAAIVLAAGESRRMGEPKQLLPWGEHTIVEQVVSTLLRSPLDEIVVVVGHRADEVRAKIEGLSLKRAVGAPSTRTLMNARYRDGMLSSIQCGLEALADNVTAAFIVLSDQPQLKRESLARLREAFESSNHGLVVPSHRMRRGHPLLLDVRKYRSEILALDGTPGLQKILRAHPDDILHVEFDDPGVLADVDTRQDYERAAPGKD